jgi:hypothetical protein
MISCLKKLLESGIGRGIYICICICIYICIIAANSSRRGSCSIGINICIYVYACIYICIYRSMVGWKEFAEAKPNSGHYAIANLELKGYISSVITQNVDRLHHKSGSR